MNYIEWILANWEIIAGAITGLLLLGVAISKKTRNKTDDKIFETLQKVWETIASVVSKKKK
jgi:hypothetical protein